MERPRYGWCTQHDEPARVWEDGSWGCWWETTVESIEHGPEDSARNFVRGTAVEFVEIGSGVVPVFDEGDVPAPGRYVLVRGEEPAPDPGQAWR